MTNTVSQIEFLKRFGSNTECNEYLKKIRWEDGVICPFCGFTKVYNLKPKLSVNDKVYHEYKCADYKNCQKKFNVTTGTIFQNSKLPLPEWFFLIYSQAINLKNVSSRQNSRNFDLTQKTMWSIAHKIRSCLKQDENLMLSDIVEVDECFVSKGNQWTRWGGLSTRKAPILGIVQRGGQVVIKCIEDRTRGTILKLIEKHVEKGTTIYTDGHPSYKKLPDYYIHDYVEHSTHEYVRGDVHTNTIENVWSLFKKSIRLAHHSVSEKHIQIYCDETAWRYNNRHLSGAEKFNKMIQLCLNNKPILLNFDAEPIEKIS